MPTPRFNLETYSPGDSDWDHTDTVETLDKTAIERGPIADRPSSGAYDDAMYYAVDQRTLWRWDQNASDWQAAAGLGTDSDPIPGTTHFEAIEADDATVANAPASATDVARKAELDVKASDPHDNTAHTETYAVDGDAQPPENHGNSAHSQTFVSDGDGTERQIWVIANGASDPSGVDPEDIILEEES